VTGFDDRTGGPGREDPEPYVDLDAALDGWTGEDDAAAGREGWGLFVCDGSASGPLQIQAFNDPEPGQREWDDDTDAWMHVLRVRSPLHDKALAIIKAGNLQEFEAIRRWDAEHPAVSEEAGP
jgi:hypothetical protein